MSTRATYSFYSNITSETGVPYSTIYVHCDGYPTYRGAEEKFRKMLDFGARNCAADAFFKANAQKDGLNTYVTQSRAAHGDTEFHYDVFESFSGDPNLITVSIYRADNEKPYWSGSLKKYIEIANNNQDASISELFDLLLEKKEASVSLSNEALATLLDSLEELRELAKHGSDGYLKMADAVRADEINDLIELINK